MTGRFSTEDAARVSFLEFECNGNEASLSQCTALTVSVACSARASIAGVSCLDRQGRIIIIITVECSFIYFPAMQSLVVLKMRSE